MYTNMWKWRILHSTRVMLLCPWVHSSFLFQWYISFITTLLMYYQVICIISHNEQVIISHNIIKAFYLNQIVQWFLDKHFILNSELLLFRIGLGSKIFYQNVKHCWYCLFIGICNPPCQQGGICVAPQLCKCKPGYYGDQCEKGLHLKLNFTSLKVSIKFIYKT